MAFSFHLPLYVMPNKAVFISAALLCLQRPCNKVCADCGAANPEWASVNLLVVICEACAGAHRSMTLAAPLILALWIFEVYMRCGLFL
uniref:Arf-GAP domain-containing protein n=1 Tax=Sinocyclocheilus rhinocerous TaxID=307959 RepID=A0A673N4I8_9TELE